MRKSVLRAYARLIARSGVNIQKGQEVFIAADLDVCGAFSFHVSFLLFLIPVSYHVPPVSSTDR